ncbi:hypothetical protein BKA65DRAFT_66060 [Rhexocercosporidium sp. MPI-PUGE-AT-0058]|nr:hypothetical protein BKA65DRAFT_66060 [Rhexocercosporidium sp. MPI-PUGE-AT-0058]
MRIAAQTKDCRIFGKETITRTRATGRQLRGCPFRMSILIDQAMLLPCSSHAPKVLYRIPYYASQPASQPARAYPSTSITPRIFQSSNLPDRPTGRLCPRPLLPWFRPRANEEVGEVGMVETWGRGESPDTCLGDGSSLRLSRGTLASAYASRSSPSSPSSLCHDGKKKGSLSILVPRQGGGVDYAMPLTRKSSFRSLASRL